jgi:hypothetical protein
LAQPSSAAARPARFSRARPISSPLPTFSLGPSPASRLLARALTSAYRCWHRGPRVRTTSSSPRQLRFPFLVPPNRIRLHISPLPCLEHHRVIKIGCRTSPLHLAPKRRTDIVPRRPRSSRSPSRPPLQAARLPRFLIGFVLARGEFALVCSTRWCFSFAR